MPLNYNAGVGYLDELDRVAVGGRGKLIKDTGVVAAGAVVDTGVLDLSPYSHLVIVAVNSGAVNRNLTETLYLDDGTTAVAGPFTLRAVLATATERIAYGPGTAAGSGIVVSVVGAVPAGKTKFTLATGGAGDGRIVIWGR